MSNEEKARFFIEETNGYIASLKAFGDDEKAKGNLEKATMAEDRIYAMEIIKQLFEITFATNGN